MALPSFINLVKFLVLFGNLAAIVFLVFLVLFRPFLLGIDLNFRRGIGINMLFGDAAILVVKFGAWPLLLLLGGRVVTGLIIVVDNGIHGVIGRLLFYLIFVVLVRVRLVANAAH